MLQIKPILAALKRHKAGTILIAVQIALTLAIVCNALFIIQQRVDRLSRPTGMDERNLIAIENRWVSKKEEDTSSLSRTDLAALRSMPGVQDAIMINSFPLRGGGWSTGIRLVPDEKVKSKAQTTLYFTDDHAIATMGVKLIAGRNFLPSEITSVSPREVKTTPQVIVTKALADKLFPDGSALGKQVYMNDSTNPPATIIGIVERTQVPWSGLWANDFVENAMFLPVQLTGDYAIYLIRAKPGQQMNVFKDAPATLIKTDRLRVFSSERGVRTFEQVRANSYSTDRGMAILMGVICFVLLGITAAGIVGLTSFWVGQRRKQIGVRRALGATKNDILSYFLTENLMISVAGVVIGAALAIGLNLWMVTQFEMARLSMIYVICGVIALLLLGQAAVLAPAMRASRVSPVEATRSV
ncbi:MULTISPECIES: ABC transporter permease [Dyella]|uniref:FtsX-like permease family protein n=2 Tax=Dyella TaxID=231454 RepID=A0A4R0YS80_9GAMM|nr:MULTISPECIES: FtsX-like permease family protein [Dyella]TBR40233.1 FtsX-like permease family protein [Dyella terrae]TCI12185.1 FtsX-like permease family protein [Dyella soli]